MIPVAELLEENGISADEGVKDFDVTKGELLQGQQLSLAPPRTIMQTLKEDKKAMIVVCAGLATAFILGTDTTIVGSLVGSQSFCYVMGNGYKSAGKYAVPAETVAIWNASAAPAQILGQFFTAPIADYFGRRAVIYFSIFVMLVGVVLEIVAPNWQTFAAASFLMKVVAGLVQSTAPLYVSELAPRPLRGILICCFLLISNIGDIIITVLLYVCEEKWPDASVKWGYRVPLLVCIALPIVVVAFQLFFLCESPSWLILRGRPEQARKAIAFMYPNRSEEEREAMFAEHEYTIAKMNEAKDLNKQVNYLDCFRGVDLRRTFCAFFPAMTSSLAGNAIIGPQKTYFFTLSGQKNSLASTCITLAVADIGILSCFACTEYKKLGRRNMLLIGQVGLLISMIGIGSVAKSAATPYSLQAGKAMLGFLCFGAALIQFGPTGVGWTYMGESGSSRLRAKTTVFGCLGNGIAGVVYNVAIPYMLTGNVMGGVAGACFWFAGWGVICLIITFFFIPDLTGRSHAQIDELFMRKIPARKFRSTVCTGEYGRDLLHEQPTIDQIDQKGEVVEIETKA